MKSSKQHGVRQATVTDSHKILECLGEAFALYRDRYSQGAFLDTVLTAESLSKRFSEMRILVAEDGSGQLAGTIAFKIEGSEGHIRGMAVRPASQGAGVAGCLLEQAEADLRAAGCTSVTLDTTRPLARAIHFYGNHGYRPTGAISSFFGMELLQYRKEL
jgi:GNAT superfamily N-acetyltransferase